MARKTPEDRFDVLVAAATSVFIRNGYRRTQIADIASVMGVAKGTVYLYVESKEALLDVVLRSAGRPRPLPLPTKLPIRTPTPASTAEYVAGRLAQDARLPALHAALARKRVSQPEKELDEILRELFALFFENRVSIKLLDRCAPDFPELASVYFEVARGGLPMLLVQYLESRAKRRLFRKMVSPQVAARTVLEALVFWAIHHQWDPSPSPVSVDDARETIIQIIKAALLVDGPAR